MLRTRIRVYAVLNMHSDVGSAVVIAGDFNTHLGTLAGPRGTGSPNQRGLLVKEFVDRNNLFISSHAQVSSGPSFTYHSDDRFSTVDYVIINRTASDLLDSCGGLFDHPLNVSDHLPLFIALQVHYSKAPSSATMPKINWEKAISTGSTDIFAKSISNFVLPFLSSSCDDATQLEQEISIACEATCKIATTVLPHFTDHKKSTREFYSDHQLKQLCKESKSSWKEWRNAGRPLSGNILEKKNLDKKKVRARINLLSARKERLQSEQIDQNFRKKAKRRFRSPGKGTPQGTRLSVDGSITTNHQDILDAWATHFESLGTSKIMESASLQQLQSTICSYRAASQQTEDFIMDVPVTIEEIDTAISKLQRGKACGQDGILPEHIIYGGANYRMWLLKVFNAIIDLEVVPPSLLRAIIVPIYKGRDPLSMDNYRGISLTSVIGKPFERILLQRITPVLKESGIPHYTQTAYQAGISCSDPSAVVQEAVKKYIEDGATAYQCFYDLEKAFDSIEYSVLLDHLYKSGVNGKTWRLIRSFYNNPCGQVRIGSQLSRAITLQRGVRQGSVLSPMLFLLVMDSLLKDLANEMAGISIEGIYAGSLCHADDLRSVTSNLLSLEKQAEIVKSFTERNFLTLNESKLEILVMSSSCSTNAYKVLVGNTDITSTCKAKCLGVVWTPDLSPKATTSTRLGELSLQWVPTVSTTENKTL